MPALRRRTAANPNAAAHTRLASAAAQIPPKLNQAEAEIIALAKAHPEWTPRGSARKLTLQASETAVVQTLRNPGFQLEHKGSAWGRTSLTSLRQRRNTQ